MQIEELDKKLRVDIENLHHQNIVFDFDEKQVWQKLENSLQKQTKRKKYFLPLGWAAAFIIICISGFLINQYSSNQEQTLQNTSKKEENTLSISNANTIQKTISTELTFPNKKTEKIITKSLPNSNNTNLNPIQDLVDTANFITQQKEVLKDTTVTIQPNNTQQQVAKNVASIINTKKATKPKLRIVHVNELGIEEPSIQLSKNELKKIEKSQEEIILNNTNNSSKIWLFFKSKNANTTTNFPLEN